MSSRQNNLALLFGVPLLLLGILYVVAVYPLESATIRVDSASAELNVKLLDYRQTAMQIGAFMERRAELRLSTGKLTARLYNRAEVVELVKFFQTSAKESKVTIEEVSPSVAELLQLNLETPTNGAPQYLNIALRVSGRLANAGEYLATLEREPMFVDLTKLHVIGREMGLKPAQYIIHFTAILGTFSEMELAAK